MTRKEAREALDALGISYPKSGKGSGIAALLKLLDVARKASPLVDAVATVVEVVEQAIVTPYEKMQRDHNFQFTKTHNGYGWTMDLDGEVVGERWRARHDGKRAHQHRRRAMQDAKDLLKQ